MNACEEDQIAALQISSHEAHACSAYVVANDLVEWVLTFSGGVWLENLYAQIIVSGIHLPIKLLDAIVPFLSPLNKIENWEDSWIL